MRRKQIFSRVGEEREKIVVSGIGGATVANTSVQTRKRDFSINVQARRTILGNSSQLSSMEIKRSEASSPSNSPFNVGPKEFAMIKYF